MRTINFEVCISCHLLHVHKVGFWVAANFGSGLNFVLLVWSRL